MTLLCIILRATTAVCCIVQEKWQNAVCCIGQCNDIAAPFLALLLPSNISQATKAPKQAFLKNGRRRRRPYTQHAETITRRETTPPQAVQVTVQDRAGGGVRATGVALRSGAQVPADVVVSNVDLPQGEQLLLPAALREGGLLEGKKFSSSVVAFYWALDKRFDQLSHHSVFLSNDYEESWASIFSRNEMPRSGNFYVHAPARTDPSVCPEGHDAIMVLVPCPILSSASIDGDQGPSFQQKNKNLKQQARDLVLRRFTEAGMTDFESHIVDEFIYSPVEWKARYNLGRGAVFGLAHGLDQLAVFRPGAAHPRVAGLYRVGASARPGNGVPLVMIGAEKTADLIIQKEL